MRLTGLQAPQVQAAQHEGGSGRDQVREQGDVWGQEQTPAGPSAQVSLTPFKVWGFLL